MRFSVVPAAYVLLMRTVDRGDEVLLQLRQNTGYRDGHWATAIAGHVEEGESVFAAACREAAEEVGVTIEPADLEPLTVMHRTHANHQPIDERVDFFFGCRRWTGQPRLMEAVKAADVRWFPVDALPEPTVPHEQHVVTAASKGVLPPITTWGF